MPSVLRDGRAVALLLAATLTILSNTIISPALPGLQVSFASSPNAELLVPLLVTAPSLAVAILAPFAGALADRFGRRRQLLAGTVLFALAGTAALWLPSLPAILTSRLLLGVAVALVMTAQTALVGDYFSGPARAQFIGVQLAAAGFGGFLFLQLAGWLAGRSAFAPFVVYAIALLYLPIMWRALTEPERGRDEDVADAEERGWPSTLAAVVALTALTFISFYLVPTQAPFYLTTIGYAEPSAAALVLGAVTLSGGLFSLAYARVRAWLGRALTPVLGYVLFAAGFGLVAVANDLLLMLAAGILLGAATGFLFPSFLGIALEVTPARRRGLASGAVTMSIFLGQFLSPLVGQPLIRTLGDAETFALAAGVLAVLAIVAPLAFRERSSRDASQRHAVERAGADADGQADQVTGPSSDLTHHGPGRAAGH